MLISLEKLSVPFLKGTKEIKSENQNQSACQASFGRRLFFPALFAIFGLAFFYVANFLFWLFIIFDEFFYGFKDNQDLFIMIIKSFFQFF